MKVSATKLNSANVKYDNLSDVERTYDIESNVNIQETNVISFDGGIIKKDDVILASFSKYGNGQVNINFRNIETIDMCAVLVAINSFFEAVELEVSSNSINI